MGPTKELVPVLLPLLKDENAALRRMAARNLGEVGAAAPAEGGCALLAAYPDRDAKTTEAIVAALPRVLPALRDEAELLAAVKRLGGPVRLLVADRLTQLLPASKDELLLTEALRTPVASVRAAAAERLGVLGATVKESAPGLGACLKDIDGRVRVAAALALWKVTGKAEESVRVLSADLKICDNAPDLDKERPGAFKAPAQSGYVSIVFKKS